ncbi:MAG TPA: hypothetical protein VNH18_06150 [Bryobacteraceae bacterium]|nr:hypothetical protein [Bryobacteraceae bacterium]
MKGWYETRFRLLLLVAATLVLAAVASDSAPATANLSARGMEATTLFGATVIAAILLAGAGMKTQPGGFRPTKGLHGSMYYTLSLPVTRRRLFSVRVSLDLAEAAGIHLLACCSAWLAHPAIRLQAAPADMLKHGVAAFFCVTAVYSLGVLFATFLDDLYQTWASMFALMAVIVILNRVPLPPYLDAFLVLSRASPLITHTMPWIAMATLLALSAMLLLISVRIVEWREY